VEIAMDIVSSAGIGNGADGMDAVPPPGTPPVTGQDIDEEPGTVEGRVVDATGAPVSGATVAVAAATRPTRDIAAVTTAEGRFRLGGLLPGTYELQAWHGRISGGTRVDVAAGLSTPAEIRLG
jgi:hypothetical protein